MGFVRNTLRRRMNNNGNVAIETALLFPLFFVMFAAIFDLSMFTYSRVQTEALVHEVGRKAITGKSLRADRATPAARQRQLAARLRQELRKALFHKGTRCEVSSQVFARVGEISTSAPPELTAGMFGQSSEIVKLTARCRYIYFFPIAQMLDLGYKRGAFQATTFVFNEPY